jgi:biopolymer transport protein ExbB
MTSRKFRAAPFAALVLGLTTLPASAAVSLRGESDAFGMFLSAVPTVKAVMVVLAVASLVSWGLFVAKWLEIRGRQHDAAGVIDAVRRSASLAEIGSFSEPTLTAMKEAIERELAMSQKLIQAGLAQGAKQRIDEALLRIETRCATQVRQGLPLLATVGSAAPFIGLFGTVWGIMHSFMGIAGAGSTSLTVVAPGISEALLATAMGLVAAIPATVMYNLLGRMVAQFRQFLGECASELTCVAGREIDAMVLLREHEHQAGARLVAVLR